jgi:hypothetical protein
VTTALDRFLCVRFWDFLPLCIRKKLLAHDRPGRRDGRRRLPDYYPPAGRYPRHCGVPLVCQPGQYSQKLREWLQYMVRRNSRPNVNMESLSATQ